MPQMKISLRETAVGVAPSPRGQRAHNGRGGFYSPRVQVSAGVPARRRRMGPPEPSTFAEWASFPSTVLPRFTYAGIVFPSAVRGDAFVRARTKCVVDTILLRENRRGGCIAFPTNDFYFVYVLKIGWREMLVKKIAAVSLMAQLDDLALCSDQFPWRREVSHPQH